VSRARRGNRFSYLADATENPETKPTEDVASGQEKNEDASFERNDARETTGSSDGGGEGRSHTEERRGVGGKSVRADLASVPKGTGRMKQERSQLNVRLPTALKRQASAKAVLEGRDIGEVVEALLREYLER
jgi:hypothetical protein